ncbi:MAG: hypothetical protein Q4B26_06730 [Eubacteriales bacterium]|nr:hypothetical protein [Eubacteriales bacterium]
MSHLLATKANSSTRSPFEDAYDKEFDRISLFGNKQYKSYFFEGAEKLWNFFADNELNERIRCEDDLETAVKDVLRENGLYRFEREPASFELQFLSDLSYFFARTTDPAKQASLLCEALEVLYDGEWTVKRLVGEKPNEWILAIYDADQFDTTMLHNIEVEFWKEGIDWIVRLDSGEEELFYSHSIKEEEITQELKEAYGCESIKFLYHAPSDFEKEMA